MADEDFPALDGHLLGVFEFDELAIHDFIELISRVDTNEALPTTLSRDQNSFLNAVRLLKLDPARIVPVHGKPIPWSDFAKIAGNKSN